MNTDSKIRAALSALGLAATDAKTDALVADALDDLAQLHQRVADRYGAKVASEAVRWLAKYLRSEK